MLSHLTKASGNKSKLLPDMKNDQSNPSFKLREATIADVLALATLHVETFNETHGFNSKGPTLELRRSQWQKAFQEGNADWFCFVVEDARRELIRFAKGQPYQHSNEPDFAGELNKIYLLKKYHKRGLGKQLICKVAQEFMLHGIFSMLLFVDANNPSNGFYERMGGDKLIAKNGEFHGGYGWNDLKKLVMNCKSA